MKMPENADSAGLVWHEPSFVTDFPADGAVVRVLKNHWWLTNEAGQIAFFKDFHPQCNPQKAIADMRGGTSVQLPVAFVAVDLSDYSR